ncbi:MAG TPA: efflux transporter outer membrane subunit [Gemmatimonadales bacterium]|nr:efflux transporter outer membrane subunit [Gemmatimonadales bacterium]
MSRAALIAGFLALTAGGCAVGPSYREPVVAPEDATVGLSPRPDSIRTFYDSLAAADSAPATRPLALQADSADLAWLAVLKDTTLVRLVGLAVRENRDVQTAVARIREFRAQVGVTRSELFPELSANGSASTNQIALGAFEPVAFDALRVTADVAWELDFWGRIRRGVQASRADLEGQEAAYRATLLTLVSDVSTAYLSLLELGQEEAIAERTLASRRATLELARSRFESGVISELDVHQFESEVAVPAAALAQARRLRSQREHELATLVGRLPFDIPATAGLADAVESVRVPDSLPAALLSRRPDVREAERAFAASVARVGVAQASRLPRISITGNYGSQSSTADDLFTGNTEVYQLQAGISIPLFTGGRLANEARAAGARAEQARLQFEQTVLEAFREASDALVAVRTSRDQRVAQQSQVVALRKAAELADIRYRGGVASYFEVLDAQRQLFSAELGLSQTQLLELSSVVGLYRALGGSWAVEEGEE